MVRFIYERRGFTLIEILIAITIMGLVVGGAISIYLMSITAWREGSVQIALQREGSLAMEKMVRGIDPYGRKGIREAQQISLPATGSSGTRIDFVDADNPNPTRSFYFSPGSDGDPSTVADNQLRYIDENGNDTPIIENNVLMIKNGVPISTFDHLSAEIVTINLGMQDRVRDKDINVDLSTTVKIRN